jgi:hypothetical protein
MLAVLLMLEPVVRTILGVGMLLGVVASILFEISAVGAKFPFLVFLGASLSLGVLLLLYEGLVALLSD